MKNILITILIGAGLISCSNDLSKIPKLSSDFDFDKDKADEVTIIISQSASVKTEITAPLLIRSEKANPPFAEMPYGLKANFFNEEKEIETVLTAKYARFFTKSQNILVQDSVVVSNKDGSMLFTEELIWNHASQKFYSEQEVFILREGSMAYGDGLEANKDLTEIKILRQKGVIPVSKGTIPVQ